MKEEESLKEEENLKKLANLKDAMANHKKANANKIDGYEDYKSVFYLESKKRPIY